MSTLHIFCPWHEEALAAHSPHFTPTRAARQMADSLCTLPAWWAKPGDMVWVPNEEWTAHIEGNSGVIFSSHPDFSHITSIDAWGWSLSLHRRLQRLGCPEQLLPSEEQLHHLREMSNRRSTTRMLQILQQHNVGQAFASWWCEDEESVRQIVTRHGGDFICKAPWSGSGRGVFRLEMENSAAWQRLRSTLHRQGGVELEPFYNRWADFAMEFRLAAGKCEWVGLSLFSTGPTGAYTGNIVASDEALVQKLCARAEESENGSSERIAHMLTVVQEVLMHTLPEMFSSIEGYVGVDMMLVQMPDESVALHPCVELNLRRTMGLAAISMRQHLPHDCAEGRFCVRATPPLIETGKDSLQLTPPGMPFEARLFF